MSKRRTKCNTWEILGGGGNSSTLAILEKIEALVAENQQLKEQISSMQNRLGMFDCSVVSSVIRNTTFAEALADARAKNIVGFTSYYSVSDCPPNIQAGFLLYACNHMLGNQTALLAFYSNKMAIGMMASNRNIAWKEII